MGTKPSVCKEKPTSSTRCKHLGWALLSLACVPVPDVVCLHSAQHGKTQSTAPWAWVLHLRLALHNTACVPESELAVSSASTKSHKLFRSWDTSIMQWSALSGTFDSPFSRELSDGLGRKINFSWVREWISENLGSSSSFCLCCKGLRNFDLLFFFWCLCCLFVGCVCVCFVFQLNHLHEQY